MTCIVGLVHKNIAYIGGDSASVEGWNIRPTKLHKVFRKGSFIIGYTTSFRMGQILQYHLKVPPKKSGSDEKYMVTIFVEEVRKCFTSFGFATIDDNKEQGGQFLVAYNKNLYSIDSDYQVNSSQNEYEAIGAGVEFAHGSLFSSKKEKNPRNRIKLALEAAAYHSIMVIPPFRILVQK